MRFDNDLTVDQAPAAPEETEMRTATRAETTENAGLADVRSTLLLRRGEVELWRTDAYGLYAAPCFHVFEGLRVHVNTFDADLALDAVRSLRAEVSV